jgi:hypothetical protein
MSEDQDRYYKLASIVDDCLDDCDLTNHWFPKFLKWGIRGLEELKLDVYQDVKTCLLEVSSRKTVILPTDFVDWTKVGIQVGQYCVTLGVNDDLTDLQRTDNSPSVLGLFSQHSPAGIDFGAYGGFDFYNYNGCSLYGVGYGLAHKGYFKVIKRDTCKELTLDYDYPYDKIYVEYISNGFDPCGETVLDAYMKDYTMKFIDYMYEDKNNPKANESSIARKGAAMEIARKIVRARYSNIDKKTFINISRKGTKLTPKIA